MGKLMKNGRPYGGHSTTAATVNYTDTHNIGATNTQDALDRVAQRVISQSAASGVSYTDTNSIGATNVQSAVDKLSTFTTGTLTVNSTYANGNASYQKFGKVVTVFLADIQFVAQPAGGSWNTAFISGLPKVALLSGVNPKILLQPVNNSFIIPIRLAFGQGGTELFFHWTVTSGVPTNIDYEATFSYICE